MSARLHSCPHCGCMLTKQRSGADHRRFFGLIAKAYDSWPEAHEFRPSSAEHLRAHLLIEAGHYNVTTIDLSEIAASGNPHLVTLARLAVEATVTACIAARDYVVTRPRGNVVEVLRPKSIAWHELDQRQFGPVREAVEQIIEQVIGVSANQLLKERAA